MKIFTNLTSLLKGFLCAALAFAAMEVQAQAGGGSFPVSGTVKDATGAPVIGATVIDVKTQKGCATDTQGKFTIDVTPESTLSISFIGYTDQEVKVIKSKNVYNIVLATDALQIEELVVVGYGVQKKATLTGAVSSVVNKDIVSTKNENVQNMLTGKVSGLRVVQNSSEPGQFNTSMDIRGFGAPLVIVDGIPRSNMSRIDPEDIESISVLKDASAAIYGVRAANGVILITTKKGGGAGNSSISYSGNVGWQIPSNFPELVDVPDWMTLYNERSMHNPDTQTRPYTDAQIEEYRNGTKQSTNWKEEVFRNSAPQTQHTISATGSTDRISYYSSVGYQYQGSFLQTDAINYEKYTLRSNVSAKISKNIQFDLNLSGLLDERKSSVYGSSDIVRGMWLMQPMDKVYYNQDEGQYWQPGNTGLQNPVAMMNKDLTGQNSYKSKWFQSSASLTYNIPYVTGLSLKGTYSYDFTLNDNKEYRTSYQLYDHTGKPMTWLTESGYPNKVSRYYYGKNASLWNVQLAYNNKFGRHGISAMMLFENSHNDGDNFYGNRLGLLPIDQIFTGTTDKQQFLQSNSWGSLYDYANQALVGRVNYDFAGKYIAEVAFRYEGSSYFPDQSRWALFPSVSLGWRVSEEKFWKESSLNFINNLKLRASYGKMGDDSALAFQFLTGYNYPSTGTNASKLPPGSIFDDKLINSSNNKGLANKNITWSTSKTLNLGLDLEAWSGMLGVTAEYFRRTRDGLLTTRSQSLPGVVGAQLPQENLNSDLTQGFELELSHRHQLGEFQYQVKGNMSYTRIKTIYNEQARQGNSYLNWRNNNNNRYNNIWWGYGSNGRITSWDEIYDNPVYIGRGTIIGDYEYEDWNGDGAINDLDVHPLANNGSMPLFNYGLTISAQWRGIDFSMLWQGVGKRYIIPRQFLYQPLWSDTNAITDFLDRWHPADPTANPYDPATEWIPGEHAYTGTSPDASSDFNIQNAAYLRLKNIELGYTLPKKWLKKVNIQSLRIYFSAYNLLTFTKLKYMDPEFYMNTDIKKEGLGDLGYNYPLNKTMSVGVNVKF